MVTVLNGIKVTIHMNWIAKCESLNAAHSKKIPRSTFSFQSCGWGYIHTTTFFFLKRRTCAAFTPSVRSAPRNGDADAIRFLIGPYQQLRALPWFDIPMWPKKTDHIHTSRQPSTSCVRRHARAQCTWTNAEWSCDIRFQTFYVNGIWIWKLCVDVALLRSGVTGLLWPDILLSTDRG